VSGDGLHVLKQGIHREFPFANALGRELSPAPGLFLLRNGNILFRAENRLVEFHPATGRFIPTGAKYLLPALWNSFFVGVAVAALNLLLSATAAYAIALIHFRGRRFTLYTILVTRVIPDIALIVPLFLLLRNFGLINTKAALITYLAVTVPFTSSSDQLFPVGSGRAVPGGAASTAAPISACCAMSICLSRYRRWSLR
jgi:ABC-type sugar transport system permease subunit